MHFAFSNQTKGHVSQLYKVPARTDASMLRYEWEDASVHELLKKDYNRCMDA